MGIVLLLTLVTTGDCSVPISGDRSGDEYTVVADTRRRWSAAEKVVIVAEASGSCANISAVARRHGINPSLLFRWRKALAGPDIPQPAFVPIALPAPIPPAPIAPAKLDTLDILLAGGRTVRVRVDIDPTALVRIVSALEGRG
jgi:transposase